MGRKTFSEKFPFPGILTMYYESHRGVSFRAPENTLAAFSMAADLGYDLIELDTKFTKDDVCVALHDRTLNRTCRLCDGSPLPEEIRISDITFEEARRLDAGIFRGECFRGERIPTADEFLSLAVSRNIALKFDNVIQSHTPEQLNILFDCIEKSGAYEHGLVGLTSNSAAFIKDTILPRFPDAYIHYDGDITDDVLETLHSAVAREKLTVWMRYDNKTTSWNHTAPVTAERVSYVHPYAMAGIWIIEEQDELDACRSMGADIIETSGKLLP